MERLSYFKIGNVDFSHYVNSLKITKQNVFNQQTNAAGNSVVDYVNSKREIEVGIIPLTDTAMLQLQTALAPFSVSVSFRNPVTNALEENVACIIPQEDIEYYTIQANKVMYKAFTLKFTEL